MLKEEKMNTRYTLFAFLLAAVSFAGDTEIRPSEIVRKSDEILFGNSAEIGLQIKVFRKGKEKNEMRLEGTLKGEDKMVLYYTYPPRNKNNALLKNGDNLWMFFDAQKRFLSIGSRQLMGGSDFSFGDLLNVNLNKDYIARLLDDTTVVGSYQCYRVELKAREKSVTYDKILCYIRKDFAPIKREFFTASGDKFK
ncbi:MAG: outer membrane lipoprotein-sorting protein, partial [Chitinivibrionales bacterium]|nr:outer membrane lipoprotein-sorting protein [Chitinivibrionales bacterium]